MKLPQLLETIQEKQIAEAQYKDSFWYVTFVSGQLHFWHDKALSVGVKVPMVYSNLHADYTIIKGESL